MDLLGRFLTKEEKKYFSDRKKLIEKSTRIDIADNPFLYATRQSVSDLLVRIELFKKIKNLSGHIIECGVNRGNSYMLFSHLSAILEPYAINRKIIGFDSFDGFRSIDDEFDPPGISEKDFQTDYSYEMLSEAIEIYDGNRPLSHMSRNILVKGNAVNTIPEYVASHPELTISLLYLDFDLYKPTLVALQHLLPLVCKNGIVVLDEFNYDKFSGETAALKEVLQMGDISMERFSFAPFVAFFRR